jgi:glycosyltransferase involved in cell wall biosynthesis
MPQPAADPSRYSIDSSSRVAPELATWQQPIAQPAHGKQAITFVLHCFNEESNIREVHQRLANVGQQLLQYNLSFLFIDNASTDQTVDRLREIAAADPRVSVIVNARNFGHIRSPFHALMQAGGDCVIAMSTDLQEPPELALEFVRHWEKGASMVVGMKKKSEESHSFFLVRTVYYKLTRVIADVPVLEHVTGFGLYDRRVIEIMRRIATPYPYFRGMIAEIGLPYVVVPFEQPARKRGISKNNFYTLYDIAMLGMTSHSKVPLRVTTFAGFAMAAVSLCIAILYLILKLLFWSALPAGYAPVVIGVFFLGSVQIFLMGILGEYIGAILTQVQPRTLVVERERFGRSLSAGAGNGDTPSHE